jgi:hypothetical protein
VGAIDRHIPVCAHQQQTRAMQIAREVQQQVECAAVSVVHIFEHQKKRLLGGGVAQEVGGSL